MSTLTLPDFTGQLVDEGRLHLTAVLGAGNYGVVYMALDTSSPLDTPAHFAVKCLGPVAPNTTQGSRHDEREIKLHTQCSQHPNVATLHRRFCYQGFLFIVLELSAGGNLFDAIDGGVFRNNDALVRDVFLQLIDTVRFCHERGIYHRDIKPENILCSAEGGDIRLADFGLAIDCGLPSSSAGGSFSYMTPESVTLGSESESYDPSQSDVWALCITLINIISALYPWRKAIDSDTGFEAFLTDGDYLRRLAPISDPLNDLLERCFRPVPQTRPTLLQLRTEIANIPALFSSDGVPIEFLMPPLLGACHSAPHTPGASFEFSRSLCPSTAPSSAPSKAPSASFDPTILRPTLIAGRFSSSLLCPHTLSSAPSSTRNPSPAHWQDVIAHFRAAPPSAPKPAAASPPAPKMPSRNPLKRLARWIKKGRRGSSIKKNWIDDEDRRRAGRVCGGD